MTQQTTVDPGSCAHTSARRRRRRWPWVLVIAPVAIVLIGIAGATYRYGFATVEQAGILGYTMLFPYTPSNVSNTFVGPWRTLPEPGQSIGRLRISSLRVNLPIVQGTYPDQVSEIGHFAGSTLPGQGADAVLVTENAALLHLGAIKPGTPVQWVAPQGTFSYRVTESHAITSLVTLSEASKEALTLVEQSRTPTGTPALFAVFLQPTFRDR